MLRLLTICSFSVLLSLVSCGGIGSPEGNRSTGEGDQSSGEDGSTSFKVISVLSYTLQGNFGASVSDPIAEADGFCATEFNGNFKALLGRSDRDRNASGWVLKPNTEYRRSDGVTVIGTTNASAVFDFSLGVDLINPVLDSSQAIWTGLDQNLDASHNCNNWTDTSTGVVGWTDSYNNLAFGDQSSTHGCGNSYAIYCVEQ